MQVITQRALGTLQATLYKWNGKYILKLEMPMLEQTFKWSEMDVTGQAEVLGLLDNPTFIAAVMTRFESMQQDLTLLG